MCRRTSLTRSRTVQMRRAYGSAACFAGSCFAGEGLVGALMAGFSGGVLKRRPNWGAVGLCGSRGGLDGFTLAELAREGRARRLARVGGFSSRSDILGESSIWYGLGRY